MKTYAITLYRDCFGNISGDPTPTKKTITIRDYLAQTNSQKLAEVCEKNARKRKTYFYRIGKSAGYAEAIANAPLVAPELIGTFTCHVDGRFKEWQVRRAIIDAIRYGRHDAVIEPKCEENKPAHLRMCYCFSFSKTEASK